MFRRTSVPDFGEGTYLHDAYAIARTQSFLADTVVVGGDQTIRSSNSGAPTIWPANTFNLPDTMSDIAHLVPASAMNAGMYADVARCVFAVPDRPAGDEAADGPILQKLIHGCGLPGEDTTPHTGMKHMLSNKIRLPLQGPFFDRNPCFCIIPCLSLAAVKAWNGHSYTAIVLAGSWDGTEAWQVYRDMMAGVSLTLASVEQVNNARDLLTDTVLALAYSFHHRRERMTDGAHVRSIQALERIALTYADAAVDGQGIKVPTERQHPLDNLRVGLIEYAGHDGSTGHPAPDPMLLVIKAAINWSWRNNQKMMMEGKPEEPEVDELDILAEERYLEFHQESCRTYSLEELAARLHQPNGWEDRGTVTD
jgi:hypothetical protein